MIAVTGANGLLGSFIIRKLLERNVPCIALRRKGSDVSLLNDVNDKIVWRDADIMDPVQLQDALTDASHVIHTAAIVSFNPRRAAEVMDINILGTRNVVNACIAGGVKRLVHISSVAALGRQKGQQYINENNKWVDSPQNSTYAKSKYLAELEVFRGQEEGLSTVILSPSLILAGANWNVSSAQLFKYVWQQRPFFIDGYVNYVDVLDVAELAYLLMNDPDATDRFVISAGKITYQELFSKMAHQFRKKSPAIRLSGNVLKPVAFIESIRTRISGTEPRITRETARLAGSEFLFENQKIRNKLNFEFQPIDETLQRCCRYYIDKMKAKK